MRRRVAILVLLLAAALPAQSAPATDDVVTLPVTARVVDSHRQPIANAGLAEGPEDGVTTQDALSHPAATADANGRIACELKIPRNRGTTRAVLITAPGKISIVARLPHPNAAPALDLGEIVLIGGVSLEGLVRDGRGKPLAGALVVATDPLTGSPFDPCTPCCRARTQADGSFVLPAAFAPAGKLEVVADGYWSQARLDVTADQPLVFELEPGGFVGGTIVDADGKPWSGVVELVTAARGGDWQSAPALDGRFRLPLRWPGPYRVLVRPSGLAVAESGYLRGPTNKLSLRIPARPPHAMAIRAKAVADGQPVPRLRAAPAWVGATPMAWDSESFDWGTVASGADGRAWVRGPGEYEKPSGCVRVLAAGFEPLVLEIDEFEDGRERTAALDREARIAGRVVDADGKPVARASIEWRLADIEATRRRSCEAASVATGADGQFGIGMLGEGRHVLTARRPGATVSVSRVVDVARHEVAKVPDIALPAGTTLTGKVVPAPTGAGWRVHLLPSDKMTEDDRWEEARKPERIAAVARDGSFALSGLGAESAELVLVIPAPPRTGADLRVPLGAITIGAQPLAPTLDVSTRLPGRLVARFRISDAIPVRLRLVLVAIECPDAMAARRGGGYREERRRRRWTLLDPTGAAELDVTAGQQRVHVVDVATGVVVFETSLPLAVASGQPTRLEQDLPVAALRVELDAGTGTLAHAERLAVRAATWAGNRASPDPILFSTTGSIDQPTLDLLGAPRPWTLLVPPGRVMLRVPHVVIGLAQGAVHYGRGDRHAGETEVEAEAGKVLAVRLRLAPPLPMIDEEKK